MNFLKHTLINTVILSFLFLGCKKKEGEDNHDHNHGSGTGSMTLRINFKTGTKNFSLDSVYQDDFGNDYKFSLIKIYIGNIGFEDHDNNLVHPTDQFLLLDPSTSHYNLGTIIVNHYHNLIFNIGLDSTTNHSDPNSYPATSPLYPQTPNMHWGWSNGYIFYKLEGVVDTNNDANFETNFVFHIGSNVLNREQSLVVHTDIIKDQSNIITLNLDPTKFFSSVNLQIENSTHTLNDLPLATKLADNGNFVFSVP